MTVLAGPHFITTTPSLTVCHCCSRPVLAATVGGLDRHVDPAPLTDAGELAALLDGRATFQVRGLLLARRTVHHIRAGTWLPVLAAHSCAPVEPGHVDQAAVPAVAALLERLADAVPADDPDAPIPY